MTNTHESLLRFDLKKHKMQMKKVFISSFGFFQRI